MNRIYRNVWNEVTRTYVAAAEIVRGRGKRSKSSATAQASEAAMSAVSPEGLMAAIARAQAQAQSAATKAQRRLRGAPPRPMLLEQRFMFDGAALVDGVDTVSKALDAADTSTKTVDKTIHLDIVAPAGVTVSDTIRTAKAEAEKLVADFLARSDAKEQLFALFNGGKTAPDAAWNAAFDQLMAEIQSGGDSIRVEMRTGAELQGAFGAFAQSGPDGNRVIYLNSDWVTSGATSSAIAAVLVEEAGHSLDSILNLGGDSVGDEGERFSVRLVAPSAPLNLVGIDNDHTSLRIEDVSVQVELASFNFPMGGTAVGAYEMVYDLDGSNAVEGNRGETAAEKEQSSHNFRRLDGITKVVINDSQSAREFSGNDVSVTATFTKTDNTSFVLHGWVSRPIKVGGVVKGFYFWTDSDFSSLQTAQADTNSDGDRSTVDNRGFLFVVDQAHFNSLSANTVNGAINIFNIGSSSDRVDSALNSLLQPNLGPVASNDSVTVLEDSSSNIGNVLTNDTDANGDPLSITAFKWGTTTGTVGTPLTLNGIGTLTLTATGGYTFTPTANYAGTVPSVTYTVSDGTDTSTGTLSIAITPINDAPAGADKTVALAEGTSYSFTSGDFGFTDPIDTPANSLLAVKITTLPTNGSLTLNSAAVTAGQTITLADLTNLKFTPAANGNGSPYTTYTFQVQDNGGTANGGIDLDASPNTITFNVTAVNLAPVGVADTATIGEAGGVNNGTNPTPNVTGDVLTNDTDADTGDTKTVTAVTGLNTGTVGSSVAGRFGDLVLNPNGTFTYTLNNSNATVQALRTANASPSEVFTYTVTDRDGLSSTTTLTITVTPANDAPFAVDDYNTVKEAATELSSGVWGRVTADAPGVLTNDSDVDGGTLVATTVSTTIVNADVLTVTSPIDAAATTYTVASGSNGSWQSISTTATNVLLNGNTVTRSDGSGPLTVYRDGNGINAKLIFNHPATLYTYSLGTVFGVASSTDTFMVTSITPVVSSSTTLDVTSGDINTVAVGDAVSGTGIPSGTTVFAVNTTTKKVTLTNAAQITSRDITFTAAGGTTSSQNVPAGSSVTLSGNYGNLVLSSSGGYTYNLTNNSLNDGQTANEAFTYTVSDSAGGTTTAVLKIRIDGRSAVTVAAANDSYSVDEDTTLTKTAASGVLVNDTPSSTVSSYTWGSLITSIGNPVTYDNVGTLTLNANGSFTFVPVTNFNGAVPPVVYTISNGAGRASAVLSITVNAVNDAPAGVVDTATAREEGGYDNATAGVNPTGNVLTNDTDIDSGDTKTVSALAGGNVNVSRAGTYGDLLLQADGSYTYTVRNGDAAVQALNQGTSQTDTFTYTVRDGAGATDTATLTVTINGANDAPVNGIGNATRSLTEYETLSFTGGNALTVSDPESNFPSSGAVTLSVGNGTLTATASGTAAVSGGGTGTMTISRANSGTPLTKADMDAVLATLVYTPSSGFTGSDLLRMATTDTPGLVDVDTVAITVNADNRPLTVTGTTVNEASPYVMFQVTGAAGQRMTLALGNSAVTTDNDATSGLDFRPSMEYFDSTNSTWVTYTGAPVAISATGTTLLVRVPVLNDALDEGSETLTLTATNRAGTASTPGISTIRDDAQGSIFLENNNTFTPSTSNQTGYPTYLDDDRPVTVNSIAVNEGSPKAVFTVTGNVNQVIKLNLIGGSAQVENGTAPVASDGSEDFGPALEIWDGTSWVGYTAGSAYTMTGTTLLVRTAIHQDTLFEGQEAFFLKVIRASSDTIVNGTGSIYDDGTGTKYPDVSPGTGSAPVTETTNLDDDRTIAVSSPRINEGSNYVVFTVTGNSGQTASLQLVNESAGGTVAGKANIDAAQTLKIWDGVAWVDYSSTNLPTFDRDGKFYVRVDIRAEQDTPYEGPETFKLNATVSGQSTAASGTATIIDDGTETKIPENYNPTNPNPETTNLDDDRQLSVTGYGPVNEGSTYAMFTVTSAPNKVLDLALQNAASGTAAAWAGFTTIEFSTDGTTWTTYSSTNRPTVPAAGKVYVRVTITSETDNVFEGSETFALKASWVDNASVTAFADTSIVDNGTGKKYGPNAPGGNPAETTTDLDDDRSLTVSGLDDVSEGSNAIFTVNLPDGNTRATEISLALSDVSTDSTSGNPDDYSSTFTAYYYDGATKVDLPITSGKITLPAGFTTFYVKAPTTQDTTLEGAEDFRLIATITGGRSANDTSTINDDADVDGITTYVESVLAKRANGQANPAAEPFNGDLNGDVPTSQGDGFQNAVTTFSWINNVYFDAANADPLTVDAKSIVTLVAEDTATSNGEPDPAIQLRNVVVPALTAEQQSALQTYLRFTPGWTPLGFSAEIRPEAQPGVTNIDHDGIRTGNQWRFTVDISRSGETQDTFMGFIKWVDQATIDAYVAADVPLLDLTGDAITAPGWVDFTRLSANGDGVSIGQTEDGGILFLDYIITDNAFGDLDLREGYITDPGIPIFVVRTIEVTGKEDVAEGSNAVFTVSMNAPKSLPTEIALQLSDDTGGTDSSNGQPLDYSSLMMVYYFDAQGMKQSLTVTEGKITLPAKVTEFFVSVTTTEDAEYEGGESFSLTATLPEGTSDSGSTTIVDDGSGTIYDERGEPDPSGKPTDDRPLSVNDIEISESSPYGVFKVTGASGQLVKLELVSGTATVGTDTGSSLEYFDGKNWQPYTPGSFVRIPEGSTTLLVRVPIVNDSVLEGKETFQLIATNTGGTSSAPGTASIFDDGTNGKRFEANNNSGNPTDGVPNDDTPVPVTAPKTESAKAETPAAEESVESSKAPVEFKVPPVDVVVVADIVTSSSGFPITVVEGSQPNLVVFNGITDQFVEARGVQTVQLPADAFAHTRSEAVITLIAQLSDGSPLPPNILFNSQAGTFQVTPRPGIFEELEITVIARDAEGREAATKFKLNIGEAAKPTSSLSRPPLSDQLRLAGANRVRGDTTFGRFMSDLKRQAKTHNLVDSSDEKSREVTIKHSLIKT
jgi:VCBS repeat-containing protein